MIVQNEFPMKKRRKKLLVDFPVQGALVRQLLFHWGIACGVILVYLICLEMFTSPEHRTLVENLAAIWNRYGALLVALATVFPAFVIDSIRLSHRFAGPMVSLAKALERMARGQRIEELVFRKSDFWRQLAANLNAIARKLDLAGTDESHEPAA